MLSVTFLFVTDHDSCIFPPKALGFHSNKQARNADDDGGVASAHIPLHNSQNLSCPCIPK